MTFFDLARLAKRAGDLPRVQSAQVIIDLGTRGEIRLRLRVFTANDQAWSEACFNPEIELDAIDAGGLVKFQAERMMGDLTSLLKGHA